MYVCVFLDAVLCRDDNQSLKISVCVALFAHPALPVSSGGTSCSLHEAGGMLCHARGDELRCVVVTTGLSV